MEIKFVQFNSSIASQQISTPTETYRIENTPWTDKLTFIRPDEKSEIPMYRVLDKVGKIINYSQDPQVK